MKPSVVRGGRCRSLGARLEWNNRASNPVIGRDSGFRDFPNTCFGVQQISRTVKQSTLFVKYEDGLAEKGFLSPKKRKNVFEGKGIFLLLNPGFRFSDRADRYRDWPPVRMKNNRLKYLRPPDPLVCVVLLRLTSKRTLFPVAKCHVGLAVVTPWSQDRYASNCRLNGRLCRTPQRTRVSARRRVPVTRFRPIAVDKRPRSNLKP